MKGTGELRTQVPCTLEGVEAFVQSFRVWHGQACGGRDAFATELLLREALGNSVAHGHGPRTALCCVLRGCPQRLLIAILDDGPGFDWRAKGEPPENDTETHGRGVAIYHRYAQRIRFNTRGNGVALVRLFAARPKE